MRNVSKALVALAFVNCVPAARLRGKLLMIMGELDENAVPGATLQLADALGQEPPPVPAAERAS